MFRSRLEASLHTTDGVQRLSRRMPNELSRVQLLPREPLSWGSAPRIVWRVDGFHLVHDPRWGDDDDEHAGGEAAQGEHLADGATFLVGQSTVTFRQQVERWPVDLERERALLAAESAEGWSVYGDELVARGDPVGLKLARDDAFDVAFALDVQPLLANGPLEAVGKERAPWQALTFTDPGWSTRATPALTEGLLTGVLTHPWCWFVRRITLGFARGAFPGAGREKRQQATARAQAFADAVGRLAGPHLEVLAVQAPAELPTTRPGVKVERA
jgi:hypothetical protein